MKIKDKEGQEAILNLSELYNSQVEELLQSLQVIDDNVSSISISVHSAYTYYFVHYNEGVYPWIDRDVVHYEDTLSMIDDILYRTILFRKFN